MAEIDHRLVEGVQPGLFLYDLYSDGAAAYIVSHRHPLIDMVPVHRHWLTGAARNFNADVELLRWLDDHLHYRSRSV